MAFRVGGHADFEVGDALQALYQIGDLAQRLGRPQEAEAAWKTLRRDHGKNELAGFQARVKDWPAVRECWTLSGDVDFILKCVASNLSGFQAVVTELTALPNVRNVRSALTLDVVKDEPLVPLETPPAG